MTTSSDNKTPSAPGPTGDHWNELTATLSPDSKETFAQWLSNDLERLTDELADFSSPRSIRKGLSR
ncbi:hypothetical protein [Rubripirellula reticaptiva]|uniref:Uncharacterized protein n=1 Tax=Rubripirellula reticaptiva TaxID=2528013 RepID=A0A5C6F869_9BACT|nr:hypothetical protein [Rubripirellula reticaptiva]TWU57933.1 hypothetical protein Poly59_08420 [Rubripirellula reticaptiva]